MKRFLSRLIFWGLNVLTVYWMWLEIQKKWYLTFFDESADFFGSLLLLIVVPYLIAIGNMIVEVIFNFLHKFDDYTSVGDFFSECLFAPFVVVGNVFRHFLAIFKGSRYNGSKSTGRSSVREFAPDRDGRKDTFDFTLESAIYGAINDKCTYFSYIYTVGIRDISARYDVSVYPRSIKIKMNVSVSLSEYAAANERGVKNHIESAVASKQREVLSYVNAAIEEARSKYQNFDGEYSISIVPNVSFQ